MLSEEEKEMVQLFKEAGGIVLQKVEFGFKDMDVTYTKFMYSSSVNDVMEQYGIPPYVEVLNSPYIITNILEGSD